MHIVLASQSPYRRALLENLKVPFKAVSPRVDEEQLKLEGPDDLLELTRFLAHAKAESLRVSYPNHLLIGSDQVAELDGERLDKPGSRKNAIEQLRRLSGKTHRLLTSMCLISPNQIRTVTDITTITLRPLTQEMIEAYVDIDQPFDCAGSYKIERAGLSLVERLTTDDPSAIQGLPLLQLCRVLDEMGYPLHHLWRPR